MTAAKHLSEADVVIALDKDGRQERHERGNQFLKTLNSVEVEPETQFVGGQDTEQIASTKTASSTALETTTDKRRRLGDFRVYLYFFKNVGILTTAVLLFLEVAATFFSAFPTIWLQWWSAANVERPNERVSYFLGVYSALQVVSLGLFFALTWYVLVVVGIASGINLHQKLLRSVMIAPLTFLTSTDLGSLTTRFSQDVGLLDTHLPLSLLMTILEFFTVLATAALIAASTGFIAISYPFIAAVFYILQRAYLRTSRQLRFLDLDEKAPVFAQFLETIEGLVTIRAFGWEGKAIERNQTLIDRAQRPYYLLLMIQQWLTLVLDLIVTALAVLIAGLAVRLRGEVNVGLTGVSLVQLITLAETMKLLIQFWTQLETSIGAVARIKNFSEETPDENLPGETQLLPQQWPGAGEVRMERISASYGVDTAVRALDGVSLLLKPGMKVGICGRTGR
jgi:ATP-binding cassette, subfamily C (CFTR/MRP), member 1